MAFLRSDGRKPLQLRDLEIKVSEFGYADGSVLFSLGKTKVLCSVTMQDVVPHFLKGSKRGWLSAEYSMLPCATNRRSNRESTSIKRNSRSVEISRLIGRCFRSVCDLESFGEKTIQIDCDVLQADGGTRVCAISGTSLALKLAQEKWLKSGKIKKELVCTDVVAVSVAMVDNQVFLDVCQSEDSGAQADFNFVMTSSGKLIEVQGTCEQEPIEWTKFDEMRKQAQSGVEEIVKFFNDNLNSEKDPKTLSF